MIIFDAFELICLIVGGTRIRVDLFVDNWLDMKSFAEFVAAIDDVVVADVVVIGAVVSDNDWIADVPTDDDVIEDEDASNDDSDGVEFDITVGTMTAVDVRIVDEYVEAFDVDGWRILSNDGKLSEELTTTTGRDSAEDDERCIDWLLESFDDVEFG